MRRSEAKPIRRIPADLKVLVKEKIAESGVELLREEFDVELGLGLGRRPSSRSGSGSSTH